MMKQLSWLPLLLIGSAVVSGCSKNPEENSCNIKTAGVYVEYTVHAEGASAVADATFWVGNAPGGTYLTLGDCGDTITVNGQPLVHQSGADNDYYETNVTPTDVYKFVFTRQGESPYTSTVSTPAAVDITAPTAGTSISRAEAFDIKWTANPGGKIHLLISGDDANKCIQDYPTYESDRAIDDTGTYTVNAGAIQPFVSSDATKSCSATIALERSEPGTLDPSLKGTINGFAAGHTTFTSTP